jgi:transcriptional regulator with XRE-family HTH domain
MTAQQLGETVRAARQAKGYSLRELQEVSGVEYSSIAYLEQGRIGTPDPRKLHRLAQALGLNTADLYALAGYLDPGALPDLAAYLQLKYGLPEAVAEQTAERIAEVIATLQHEHGATS